MTPPRPTVEPQSLIAGDTLQWDKDVSNFPASDGWALSYTLTLVGKTPIQITGSVITSTDSTFNINVPGDTTAGWAGGKYSWLAYVKGTGTAAAPTGERHLVDQGKIQIYPNPETADATTDYRSEAKINLDQIDAVLKNKTAADVQSYKINGRELVKMKHTDLLQLRAFYAAQYRAERIAAGEQFPSRTVGAAFGPVK